METKILVMAIIEKNGAVLMRKKPAGSKPYAETWYLLGAELEVGKNPEESLARYLQETVGIVATIEKPLGWTSEIKEDHDGVVKQFVYLDTQCRYVSGEAQVPVGAEKIEWIPQENLSLYDIVPPAIELFRRAGYL